jgi:hypothetical protein
MLWLLLGAYAKTAEISTTMAEITTAGGRHFGRAAMTVQPNHSNPNYKSFENSYLD